VLACGGLASPSLFGSGKETRDFPGFGKSPGLVFGEDLPTIDRHVKDPA
jgi:hypothetical protein